MKFRKLRIAWSVFCSVLCILLIALWVRSHYWFDNFSVAFNGNNGHWLGSVNGELRYAYPGNGSGRPHWPNWRTYDEPVKDWLKHEAPARSVLGFRWSRNYVSPQDVYPIVPHWFLVSIIAVIAMSPWLPWRFSLRTLLIVMTAASVALALIVGLSRR